MNTIRIFAVLTIFLASPVFAGDAYFAASIGPNILMESDNDVSTGSNTQTSFGTGFAIGAALGYDFGNVRAEGEIAFRHNSADVFTTSGVGLDADGSIASVAFMGNAFYDIPMQNQFTPYIGAGLGVAQVGADVSTLGIQLVDDSATVFAYQVILGSSYPLNDNMDLTMDYRYFATSSPTFDSSNVPGVTFDSEYNAHTINIGVRF